MSDAEDISDDDSDLEEDLAETEELVKYWIRQAEDGDTRFMLWLAKIFMFGHRDYKLVAKDEKQGFFWYKKLADMGEPWAVYRIGQLYSKGCEGAEIRPNAKLALKYLTEAHNLKHTQAAFSIGHLYSHERDDLEVDLELAAHWYKKSIENGSIAAKANLGEMYLYGRGVEQSFAEAFRLNSEAAAKGNIPGIGNVGFCYEKGYGVPKSLEKAKECYTLGASKGSQHSAMNLSLLMSRNLITMTAEEIDEKYDAPLPHTPKGWLSYAMKEVTQSDYYKYCLAFVNDVNYQKLLSARGDVDAQVFLGFMYTYGLLHNKQNISRALSYFKQAEARDDFAREMCDYFQGLQSAMAQTGIDFMDEVFNIIIGYMFDLELQLWQWDEPEEEEAGDVEDVVMKGPSDEDD